MVRKKQMKLMIPCLLALLAGGAAVQDKFYPDADLVVPGRQLKALTIANDGFQALQGIPANKKDLANYRAQIYTTSRSIEVKFVPRMLPEEAHMSGGAGKLGVEVSFHIDPKTWTVTQVLFAK